MHYVATLWIIGILFLGAAVVGQAVKIMGSELPALTNYFTRIALATVGVVAIILGGVVHFAAPETASAPSTESPPTGDRLASTTADDVIAAWPLDEGSGSLVIDESGNSNHGKLSGSRVPSWVDGVRGTSLRFSDGAHIYVPHSRTLEPRVLSVQAWVRADFPPGQHKYILSKGANACAGASYALSTGYSGGLHFYISPNGFEFVRSPDAGPGVWDGDWHHILGTYDENVVRLYVDGEEVDSGAPGSLSIGYNFRDSGDLVIGSYPQGACGGHTDLAFSGDIDEVVLWDRPLTPQELGGEQIGR